MASSTWTTFHQHEALTTRIANILDEYPPGVSTLREYVQNADDAGASTLVLCLDASVRTPDLVGYPTAALAEYTGSSLLVYNDATFSEKDFASLSSIGKSRKREDAATIGRYGLGFNVSYHLTDVVQFVSGETVVLFDPHGRALPDGQLGMRSKFTEGLGKEYPALLDPLLGPLARLASLGEGSQSSASIDYGSPVDGTLFRLPLRTAEQATNSELSQRAITAEEVRSLLVALCDSGLGEMLLFTQSLTKVVVCVLEANGELTSLGAASVDSAADDTRYQRAALARIARTPSSASSGEETATIPTVSDAPLLFDLHLTIDAADGTSSSEEWLVCGGALVEEEASLLAAALGQPAAWAAVALPMQHREQPLRGRAFCFLPLPLPSGLPCHVNGCFALTSNRRELWEEDADKSALSGSDQQHQRKARWNHLLCSKALPPLYAHALEHLASAQPEQLGALLPTGAEGHGALWRGLQRATLRELHARKSRVCVCYSAEDTLHLEPLNGVVVAEDLHLAKGRDYRRLRAALTSKGFNVWAAESGAVEAFEAAGKPMRRAEPRNVCEWLGGLDPAAWEHDLAAQLLSFVLDARDETPRDGEGDGDGGEAEEEEEGETRLLLAASPLLGLCVVPLADGSLGTLHRARSAQRAAKANGKASQAAAAAAVPQYTICGEERCSNAMLRCAG